MIGKLRHRVSFYEVLRTTDEQGGFVETLNKIADVWAKVDDRKVSSKVEADRYTGKDEKVLTVRYESYIDTQKKVSFGDKMHEIVAIENVDGNKIRYLRLYIVGDEG